MRTYLRPLILFAFFLTSIVACKGSLTPPPRPHSVPLDAVWAGGAEGGSWIQCVLAKPQDAVYQCKVWEDYEGSVNAQGSFILRKYQWEKNLGKASYQKINPPQTLRFDFYDGFGIYLKDSQVLLPHGWVEYPFGDQHGKRQQFDVGEEIGREVEY